MSMTADELALRNEELEWLIRHERTGWKLINGRIAEKGDPTAAFGTYSALGAYPLSGALSALTLSATEQGLIPSADIGLYTPILANGLVAPAAFQLTATRVFTSTATAQNLTTAVRLGNANSSPSLGASAATAMTVSLTNAFFMLQGVITVESVGPPGTNSKALGQFWLDTNTAVGGAVTRCAWGTGTTAASFDSTITPGANGGGVWIGVTSSAASGFNSMTLQQVIWQSL
jgi:hypothetical protein